MQGVVDKFLIPRFDQLGMNATGEWKRNVKVRAGTNVGFIDGRDYTENLANGVEPGNRPEIEPLEKWVKAKLHLSGKVAKGVAFAIANKIEESGTSWYKKGGTDLIEILESKQVIDYINSQIGNYLRVEVEIQIRRTAKEVFK